MRIIPYLLAALLLFTACTLDKANYDSDTNIQDPTQEVFKTAYRFNTGPYTIDIQTINATFHKGYNPIVVKITDQNTKQPVRLDKVTLLPFYQTQSQDLDSCPNQFELTPDQTPGVYNGFSVFTHTSETTNWQLLFGLTHQDKSFMHQVAIQVYKQSNLNLNMTSFTGVDNQDYLLALVSPRKPTISKNPLKAVLYKKDKSVLKHIDAIFDLSKSYQRLDDHKLLLDPRMPEASMGNHSSPNNIDLSQQSDGYYHGIVNYTMSGNWTLNFILKSPTNQTLKGTIVPSDFTPGVPGVKSDLHIDILF
ncbi:hypothetical protein ACYSNV_04065 [Myroides sp. LJL119]